MDVTTRKIVYERKLPGWKCVNRCSACQKNGVFTPATQGVVDSYETTDGGWAEARPRFGCMQHPVEPLVMLRDGTVLTFSQWVGGQRGNSC